MNLIPILIVLIPLFISPMFYSWHEIAAFALVVIFAPIVIIFLTEVYEVLFQNKEADFLSIFQVGGLFSLAGIPIYFIFIIPIYHGLLKITVAPIFYTFPITVALIMLTLFIFLTTKMWGYIEVLVVAGCSVFHSLSILWLISKFKFIMVQIPNSS